MPDQHRNFAYGTVSTPPSPPTTGSTLTLGAGQGALMPTPPFNATIWPAASLPLASVSEIVRVTAMSGDQVTAMTRAQEGTTAQAIAGGYQFAAGITVKTVTDLEALAVPNYVTTTSTGTQNDFAPGLVSGAQNILFCNNASDLTLTGFSATGIIGGTRLIVYSIGAGNVYFVHQSAGSLAADRLTNFATSGNTPLAAGVGVAEFVYDSTVGTWRLKSHEQGAYITPTFSASDYTGGGGWTVTSGEAPSTGYYLKGRQLTVNTEVNSSTVTGGNATLSRKIPGGFTANSDAYSYLMYLDNGTRGVGRTQVSGGATTIGFNKADISNWSAATTNTSILSGITFEVQ